MTPFSHSRAPKKQLITRAAAARQKGVSRAAVTQACRESLAPACVDDKIDSTHAAYELWLADEPRGPPPTRDAAPTAPVTREEMMLLRRRKLEAEARRIEIANAQRENELVSRELLVRFVAGVDGAFRRLLTDAATSIASRLPPMVRSHAPLEELKGTIQEIMSPALVRAKEFMKRSIDRPLAPPAVRPTGAKRRPKRRKIPKK